VVRGHVDCSPTHVLHRLLFSVALTLVALGLIPGGAHLLELPVKINYAPVLYADVTSTLYRWFGLVGGVIQVGALLITCTVAYTRRKSSQAPLLWASAVALLVSIALWAALVQPVNASWATVIGGPDYVATYEQLRTRWEFGHVAAFCAWLAGWMGLSTAAAQHLPVLPAR
jgi:hypothetical protein